MASKSLLVFVVTAVVLLSTGCLQPRDATTTPPPFRELEYDYVLAVVLDCSGSFDQYMTSDRPEAFRFFARLSENFFRQRMGSSDRILLAQLSTGDRPLLWDGEPGGLRRRFPTPEAFASFLQAKSTKNGSHVYAGVASTLDYLVKRPGITENTTILTVVLSDMLDNDPNAVESKAELEDALRRYHNRNGHIGFYWVDQVAFDDVDQLLDNAGYPPRVWMGIVDDPEIPDFEY